MNLDKINKGWALVIGIGGVLVSGVTFIYNMGVKDSDIDARIFDSPLQKLEHIDHVKFSPHPIEFQKEAHSDSVFREEMRRFMERQAIDNRDMKKHIHNIDSVQWLNADQQYQIKQEIEKFKKEQWHNKE